MIPGSRRIRKAGNLRAASRRGVDLDRAIIEIGKGEACPLKELRQRLRGLKACSRCMRVLAVGDSRDIDQLQARALGEARERLSQRLGAAVDRQHSTCARLRALGKHVVGYARTEQARAKDSPQQHVMPAPLLCGSRLEPARALWKQSRAEKVDWQERVAEAMAGSCPTFGGSVAVYLLLTMISNRIRHPDQLSLPLDADTVKGAQKRRKRSRVIGIKDAADRKCA